jgi:glycosyltransferase involved in cell wall biosynthesis
MRLLIVSNLYPPNAVGGYERLCFDAAAAFAERGHAVTVLTSSFGDKQAEYPKQTVHRSLRLLTGDTIYAPFPGTDEERDAVNRSNLAALRDAVASSRPDAIFSWNLFFLDRSILEGLRDTGSRVVLMLTDNWLIAMRNPTFIGRFFEEHVFGDRPFPVPPVEDGRLETGLLARGRRVLRRISERPRTAGEPTGRAAIPLLPFDAIFGSEFVRDLYAASGIVCARQTVVHNGVRQEPAPEETFRNRARLVDSQELRLLFAGRLVDLKGADTAVEALPLLDPAELGVARVRLTVIGDSQDTVYFDRLRHAIDRSACASCITIEPPVPEAALFALFQAHDLYLFPSLYEPFSLTLIHALACGIPTIASCTGGNVEIVREGESGLLFEKGNPGDLARAVRDLALDPELRMHIATTGRRVAAGFTFERMVRGMETFLSRAD